MNLEFLILFSINSKFKQKEVVLMEHLLIAGTLVFVTLFVVGFVFYLLQAIGLYKIGLKLNIEYSWMAFIPILNFYVLGSIVSEVKIFGYTIKQMGLVLPLSIVIGAVLSNVPVLGVLFNIAVFVLYIYVLVHLFDMFSPESTAVKTIISIIVPFMLPIFLFLMRNDDPVSIK